MPARRPPLLCTCIFSLLLHGLGYSQSDPPERTRPPAGIWQGRISTIGFDLAVAVHLGVDAAGAVTATCDFVEYRNTDLAASDVVIDGRSVRFHLPWASFDGAVDEHGDLCGIWVQGLRRISIELHPTDEVVLPKRPQEPRGVLPYSEHEVAYHYSPSAGLRSLRPSSSDRQDAISLAGTLTLPDGSGPHPAILLISGSGPDTRDAPIMGHRILWVLADYLTRQGYAVLRYDERGQGLSSGDYSTATLQDLAADARAGVRFLGSHAEIDEARIGLIGHSEGGMVVAMVAGGPDAARIKTVISLGGPAIAIEPLLSRQFRLLRTANGMQAADIEVLDELLRKQLDIVRNESSHEVRHEQMSSAVHATWEKLTADGRSYASNDVTNLLASTLRTNRPMFRSWVHLDAEAALRAVSCPILILVGSKDMQVDPRLNLPAARKILADAGHGDATVRELPGLNHLFQSCSTGSYREYAMIEETLSEKALTAIRDWLRPRL